MIKYKSPQGVQRTLSLIGKVRNLFAISVGRYTKTIDEQRKAFKAAKALWAEAAKMLVI